MKRESKGIQCAENLGMVFSRQMFLALPLTVEYGNELIEPSTLVSSNEDHIESVQTAVCGATHLLFQHSRC